MKLGYDVIGSNIVDSIGVEGTINYFNAESDKGPKRADGYIFRADAIYSINPRGKWVPFLAVGLGDMLVDDNGSRDNNLLLNYGLGLKYYLEKYLALRIDVRHLLVYKDVDTKSNFELSAGLTYVFGQERKKKPKAAPTKPKPAETDKAKASWADETPQERLGVTGPAVVGIAPGQPVLKRPSFKNGPPAPSVGPARVAPATAKEIPAQTPAALPAAPPKGQEPQGGAQPGAPAAVPPVPVPEQAAPPPPASSRLPEPAAVDLPAATAPAQPPAESASTARAPEQRPGPEEVPPSAPLRADSPAQKGVVAERHEDPPEGAQLAPHEAARRAEEETTVDLLEEAVEVSAQATVEELAREDARASARAARKGLPAPPPRKAVKAVTVEFDFNNVSVKPSYAARLKAAADYVKGSPEASVRIEGHTDNIGRKQPNLVLSQKRAESVKGQLIRLGVDPRIIKTKGYGFAKPKAPNSSEAGRQKNRRAAAVIIITVER